MLEYDDSKGNISKELKLNDRGVYKAVYKSKTFENGRARLVLTVKRRVFKQNEIKNCKRQKERFESDITETRNRINDQNTNIDREIGDKRDLNRQKEELQNAKTKLESIRIEIKGNQVSINNMETNLREEKQNLLKIIQTIGNKNQIIECIKEMHERKIFPENYQDEHFTRFRDSIVRRNN